MPQTVTLKNDYREKEIFDYLRFNSDQTALQNFVNTTLATIIAGSSGAKYIGMTPNTAVGTQANVQDIVDGLIAILIGTDGAAFIKALAVAGIVGGDVQTILNNLKTYIDSQDTTITNTATAHKTAVPLDHQDNSVTDAKIGNRTVDQAIVAAKADIGTLTQMLSWIVKSIKDYTGTANWKTAPSKTLEQTISDLATLTTNLSSNYYSRTNLQTSGQSFVHWGNITNIPNLADNHFKSAVGSRTDLPLVGNAIGDIRVVANDGDGHPAMYDCIATLGTVDQQWGKIADLDYTNNHSALVNLLNDDHTQYFHLSGIRALLGNMDFNKYQALNMVVHNLTAAPANPVEGQIYYDTVNKKYMGYKGAVSGWVDLSGKGALIREIEWTTTSGQTVLDLSSVGTYEVGTKALTLYKKDISTGKYEVVDKDDYTESSSTTATLKAGASLNDQYYAKWFENSPEVINNAVQRDGTLQLNLNAEMLNGKHDTDFATSAQGTKADNALPATSYTAADVLVKVKSVDGTGSGLDADTLDGLHASDLITKVNDITTAKNYIWEMDNGVPYLKEV